MKVFDAANKIFSFPPGKYEVRENSHTSKTVSRENMKNDFIAKEIPMINVMI